MKNKITLMLVAAFVFFGTQSVKADEPVNGNSSESVTLNIKLHAIQSLVVNNDQKTVNLEYVNKDDYSKGVSVDQANHLNIYSTGGFEIKAKTSGATLTGTGGNSKTINVADVTVTPKGGTNSINDVTYTPKTLSDSEQTIAESGIGGVNKDISINYAAKGNNDYINHYVKGETPTVYTTQVTYSIVAK